MKARLNLPKDHANALHLLLARIPAHLDWAVTGSAGLRLQGVDVPVNDLDIESHPSGVDEIAGQMTSYVQETPHWREEDQLRSHFGILHVAGIKVELMGDIQHRMPDGSWSPVADIPTLRRWPTWQGHQVPVLDLAYEAQAYQELGRTAKAALIRAVLTETESF